MIATARPSTGSRTTRPVSLGVLVDRLDGDYQAAVIGGMADAAGEAGINLLCLSGGELHAPTRFSNQRNAVFELAASRDLDGLVVLSGTIANHSGLEELGRYCGRFARLPMISVAAQVAGMTSLLIDGDTALREGVRHLVEVHDYGRIAFLAGPAGNPEAQARLRVYRETLAGYDLAPPDELIAPGDFKYEAGVDAVAILLDQRGVAFDAIVVANDQMALGVIDALRARGVRVPRDIAIIGFDDIQESRYTAPPLTTIRQPLRQQGRLAIEALLRRLSGEPVNDVLTLPTELVIRRSCGCYTDARRVYMTGDLDATSIPGRDLSVDNALRIRRPQILEAMAEAVAGLTEGIPDAWESDLLDALVGELQGGPMNAFADRVNALLERVIRTGATGSAWQPALSALRRELVPCLASDPVMRSRAEDLLRRPASWSATRSSTARRNTGSPSNDGRGRCPTRRRPSARRSTFRRWPTRCAIACRGSGSRARSSSSTTAVGEMARASPSRTIRRVIRKSSRRSARPGPVRASLPRGCSRSITPTAWRSSRCSSRTTRSGTRSSRWARPAAGSTRPYANRSVAPSR